MKTTKVVGYVRVSTEEQASSGHSLGAQRSKIVAYAALYDLELVEIVVDDGQSGKTLARPGMERVLSMLKSGEVQAVLVAKLDRLTRSIADWQTLIRHYFSEASGCQLLSVTDSIDTRTAAGRLVLNVLLSVAQWEREAIGERTKDALQHKIRKCERVGRVRYGYVLAEDGKTLVPCEDEQFGIEMMKILAANGHSLRDIADRLNDRGVPTKEGRPWKHSSVKRVLSRVDYSSQ
jgi:DNA invertase Pin-like site-specific DNA recombinase